MRVPFGSGISTRSTQPWRCRTCLSDQTRSLRSFDRYTGTFPERQAKRRAKQLPKQLPKQEVRKGRTWRLAVPAAVLVGGAGSTYAFRDDIKHYYEAAERSGRVLSALYVCVRE